MFEKARMFSVVAVAFILRWCVSYHPYSGANNPPMYGDYEAQRHWQEITLNLPVAEWYANTTNNDLQYWGLDYPPLTAYHSLLVAYAANRTDPSFVKLHTSRGYESDTHKYFMRLSVILADFLVYAPAVLWFVSTLTMPEPAPASKHNSDIFGFTRKDFITAGILIYPGLILVDHGHFQYNCVSLGLFVAAVTAILRDAQLPASFLFVAALNYKQMELYHALPFFFHILGSNVPRRGKPAADCFLRLALVAATVLLTFVVIWSPLLGSGKTFLDALSRLFPLARGVFEDKVANVWCAVNVAYKLRAAHDNAELAKICLAATATAVLPSSLDLFLRPSEGKFLLALVNSALAFFLFSFQVHEKSILLVAVPVLLLFHEYPLPSFWFLLISNFSMLPLFVKDDLFLAFGALTAFYTISVCWMFPELFSTSSARREEGTKIDPKAKSKSKDKDAPLRAKSGYYFLAVGMFFLSMLGALLLTLGSVFLEPPQKYPDIFPLLVSVYSCAHFVVFFLYFNYKQFVTPSRFPIEKSKSN